MKFSFVQKEKRKKPHWKRSFLFFPYIERFNQKRTLYWLRFVWKSSDIVFVDGKNFFGNPCTNILIRKYISLEKKRPIADENGSRYSNMGLWLEE